MTKRRTDERGTMKKGVAVGRGEPPTHPPAPVRPRESETFFDLAYANVVEWWDRKMAPKFDNHRGAQDESTLVKVRHEFIEFMRDPCPEEAADAVITLMVWSHIRGFNLSEYIIEKVAINDGRSWSMSASGAMQHDPQPVVCNRCFGDIAICAEQKDCSLSPPH